MTVQFAQLRRGVLAAAFLLAACSSPRPPSGPPDLEGVIVGRTPRLQAPPTPAQLIVAEHPMKTVPGAEAPPPARVAIALEPGVQVMESLPDGRYRWAETSERWIGRGVRIWFVQDGQQGTPTHVPGIVQRRAVAVAATHQR